MNWLDIIFIVLFVISIIVGIVLLIISVQTDEIGAGIGCLIGAIIIGGLFFIVFPFLVIDKASGSTVGIITSVDKNFFGTTAVYIKTIENKEEEYCIEFDEKLEEIAKENLGKKVKITYGKRVGFYSISKCHQAPLETIELQKEKE